MTTMIRAHFDGKAIVPDEPLELPVGEPLDVLLSTARNGSQIRPRRSAEERLRWFRSAAGRVSAPSVPDEALTRESIYEERL